MTTDADCAVYVDGQLVHAALKANATHRLELARGEHLFTAECIGKKSWRQVVAVAGEQRVVQIATESAPQAGAASSPNAPAAASSPSQPPSDLGRMYFNDNKLVTPTPYPPLPPRQLNPTTLHELEGLWTGNVERKGNVETVALVFHRVAAGQYEVSLAPGPSGTVCYGVCAWAGRAEVKGDKLWLTLNTGKTKDEKGQVDFWTGQVTAPRTIVETQVFEAKLIGSQLVGKGGSWSLVLAPK